LCAHFPVSNRRDTLDASLFHQPAEITMKLLKRRVALLAAVALFASSVEIARAAELTEAKFQKLHKQLRPAKDEPWLTIPWRISLLEAQQAAAKNGKPIFIWAMDGHPLGCT
jgi:hypothetical protein